MNRYAILVIALAIWILGPGCAKFTLNVPDGYGPSRSKVDSSKVPRTTTHPDCRDRLQEAYQYIRRLESKVKRLEKDKKELKEDKKELKTKAKRLEKRLDRYED